MLVLEMLHIPDPMTLYSLPRAVYAKWMGHALGKIRGDYSGQHKREEAESVPHDVMLAWIEHNRARIAVGDPEVTMDEYRAEVANARD